MLLFLLNFMLFLGCSKYSKDYTKYVNTFIGTGGDGHTYPGASLPFGMVQLSPDTRLEGQAACGGYYFPDSTIIGFSHTHLNGVGEPEFRDLLFMPVIGKKRLTPGEPSNSLKGYRSKFHHNSEVSEPGYYSVKLDDYNIRVELTATKRCGLQRYTFPKSDEAHIILDLFHPGDGVELYLKKINNSEIEGLRRSHGWAFDQYVYFTVKFSKPFQSFNIAIDDEVNEKLSEAAGKNIKAIFNYQMENAEELLVKVGISAVSIEGARKNLLNEIPGWDFESIKTDAGKQWNAELKKIEIEGGTKEQRIVFYTAMYHAALSPNLFMDVDGQYRGIDHKIHKAANFKNYSVFSLWDTFRALHPLMNIINRRRSNDFICSLLAKYDDGGKLPMWPLAGNYTDDMLGYHAVSVITDAYIKGVRGYEVDKAFRAMKEIAGMDRLGLKYYKKIGYLPYERRGESVSKTLEYCYDDWCISQMAKALGHKDDYTKFMARAHNYENVFDPSVNFMRGKSIKRDWLTPFNPLKNSAYSEGNAYQYMFVPHDIEGLIRLMGGEKVFSNWLDTLFSLQTENEQQGMIGQYWHGNEPGHHLPYMYNYVGDPWKTQRLVNQILTNLYSDKPDGIAGNEDCGQMSAWYILSAMGFYPVAPGQDIYLIGTPLFNKATIHLENNIDFVIEAKNISADNFYIQSATLNGKPLVNSFLKHRDLINGGKLIFTMGSQPNKEWGQSNENRPFSQNDHVVTMLPYVKSGKTQFINSTKIKLSCETENAKIYYTLDGTEPTQQSHQFDKPFLIQKSVLLKMKAFNGSHLPSGLVDINLIKVKLNPSKKCIKVVPGLNYEYYEKFFVTTADFNIVKAISKGVSKIFTIDAAKRDKYFGFKFDGYIKVPADGLYTFYLKSNDGSRLYIDGKELIENDANHGAVVEPGYVGLKAGLHKIDVRYFQCGGGKDLKISWSSENFTKREIMAVDLFKVEI